MEARICFEFLNVVMMGPQWPIIISSFLITEQTSDQPDDKISLAHRRYTFKPGIKSQNKIIYTVVNATQNYKTVCIKRPMAPAFPNHCLLQNERRMSC
jgi:hypothetical protein